jgi:hypothetical protein
MADFDLRKEDYLTLRKEIETQMTELGQLERNCVLAAAAVYAWLVKDGANSAIAQFGWYIPVLFPLFGGLRSLSLGLHVFALGRYLFEIESAHLTEQQLPRGWEHFRKNDRPWIRTVITVTFWVAFLIVTAVVGVKKGGCPQREGLTASESWSIVSATNLALGVEICMIICII